MLEAHFGPPAWAPLAGALEAFFGGDEKAILQVRGDEVEPDPLPVAFFFRSEEGMRSVELEALARSKGRVLDVGACVGSVSLILQDRGYEVTALEVIPEAVGIMRARGVRDARAGRIETFASDPVYDTILLLMNGTALAGTLAGLPTLLEKLESLLAPGGQILVDSTDILGESREAGGPAPEVEDGDYPGEVQYQMEFKGLKGAPFPQLFVDPGTFRRVAEDRGWRFELVFRGHSGEYLAELSRFESREAGPGTTLPGSG